jgi:hypothetical protein
MSKAGQLPGLFYGFFRGTAGQATLRWIDVASVAEPARLGSGIQLPEASPGWMTTPIFPSKKHLRLIFLN